MHVENHLTDIQHLFMLNISTERKRERSADKGHHETLQLIAQLTAFHPEEEQYKDIRSHPPRAIVSEFIEKRLVQDETQRRL